MMYHVTIMQYTLYGSPDIEYRIPSKESTLLGIRYFVENATIGH